MSGDDDIPDYLKGVDQVGFEGQDNITVRTDVDGPLHATPAARPRYDDDDDDDDDREPFRVPWMLLLLLLVIGMAGVTFCVAGVAASGTWVNDADAATLADGGQLVVVIEEERKILDELSSRGADRNRLMGLYAAIDSASGHSRGLAALDYTRAIDTEVASIGDIRGSTVSERHKRLALAQTKYEASLSSWSSATSNPFAWVACVIGFSEYPPER